MTLSSLRAKHVSLYLSFLSFLCPLCLSGETRADELNTPYDLTLVVHVAENRLLTDVFRKRIQRDLHDGFQAALGDMGRVRVTDTHPRLEDVLKRGLQRSLDDWKDRDDKKTHFVLIDYSGVHYEIQTRQYDGTIVRASPVVRYDHTRDRDFVAKAAALLIKKDFGVLGTVRTETDEATKTVTIELRGGARGDMTRWVKKDDVFALAPPEGGTPRALKWSLLQVEQAPAEDSRDGRCVCRFFHRYRVPNIAGYSCIKLGTVQAPLRVRWIQELPGGRVKPLDQRLRVDIRRNGFDGEESSKLEKSSDLNGFLESIDDKDKKIVLYNNVAFLRVVGGPVDPMPQVPIPLYDDQPVSIEVIASKDSNTLFSMSKSRWQIEVADSVQMQANLFKSLEKLGANPANRTEIITLAKSGMNRAKKDRDALRKQREELLERYKKDPKTPIEDRRLDQLEEYEQALVQFINEQEKIEATENDPKQKRWLSEIERAKLLEKELEFGKALEIYENVLKDGYENADLYKYVKNLHKDWDPRSKEQEEARGFIYRVWPTLDISRLEEKIPAARDAFQKCKDAGDLISIRKLLKGTEGHAGGLAKKLAELRPDLIIEDEKEAQQYKKVSEQIAKLGEDVQEYLKTRAGGK